MILHYKMIHSSTEDKIMKKDFEKFEKDSI